MEPDRQPRGFQGPAARGPQRHGPPRLHHTRGPGQGLRREARHLRAGHQLAGAPLRRLRAQGAGATRLQARPGAAGGAHHARSQQAEPRREGCPRQPQCQQRTRPGWSPQFLADLHGPQNGPDRGHGRVARLQRSGRQVQFHHHLPQPRFLGEAVHLRRCDQFAQGDHGHPNRRRPQSAGDQPGCGAGAVQGLQLRPWHARRAAAAGRAGQLAEHSRGEGRALDRSACGARFLAQPRPPALGCQR